MNTKLFLLLLFVTLWSCTTRTEHTERTKELDSLLTQVDTMSVKLKNLNIESVLMLHDSVTARLNEIENIDELKQLRTQQNHLRNILEWYDNLYREVMFSRNHLESIRKKMESKKEPDSASLAAFQNERDILRELKKRVQDEISKLDKQIKQVNRKIGNHE